MLCSRVNAAVLLYTYRHINNRKWKLFFFSRGIGRWREEEKRKNGQGQFQSMHSILGIYTLYSSAATI